MDNPLFFKLSSQPTLDGTSSPFGCDGSPRLHAQPSQQPSAEAWDLPTIHYVNHSGVMSERQVTHAVMKGSGSHHTVQQGCRDFKRGAFLPIAI